MQGFLSWLARAKGIDLEPGTELQLEFSAFPTGGLGLLVILGCLAALGFVLFVYRRDGRSLGPFQRATLGALRAMAVLAALLLLLEPNLVAVKREVRPAHSILLLDLSQSMEQVDAFRRASVQELAAGWREVGVSDPAATTRIELAKALLRHEDGALLREVGERNLLRLYGFSGGLTPLPLLPESIPDDEGLPERSDPGLPAVRLPDLAAIRATGRYTNLGGAVRAALQNSRDAEIAGIILLSDGRRNLGAQGAEIARLLAQRKVPHVLVLGVGDPSETQAVEVSRVEAPEKVFQNDPFEIRAAVRAQGYDPLGLTVRLVQTVEGGAPNVVATEQVTVGGDRSEALVSFSGISADLDGRFTYRVEVDPPPGEPVNAQRHVRETRIEVLGEQTRVLLVSGGPSFEYRILKNTLVRDQTILVSCWLQSADPDFDQDGDLEVVIGELPDGREELEPYDVLIFMDPDPSGLTAAFSEAVARHVVENGAGLWWVGGEKYSLEALREGATTAPLVDLLPVEPDVVRADYMFGLGKPFPVAWPYRLTPEAIEGVSGSITRLADTRDASVSLWSRLPGYHIAFPVLRAKPGATVLIRHPSPELQRPDGDMPVVAVQFVGAGRVIYSGSDETYRWRSVFEEAYNRFWVKGIRYLFEGRLNAGDSQMRILVGDERLELGDSLKVEVEAKDQAYQPLLSESVDLLLEREGLPAEPVRLDPAPGAPGRYEAVLRPTETGFYRLRAPGRTGGGAEVTFQVVLAAVEKEGPVDLGELGALAGTPGGELLGRPAELLGAASRIPSRTATDVYRTPHALWDGMATVLAVIALLAAEWWLRKRFNLL